VLSRWRVDFHGSSSSARNAVLREDKYRNEMRVRRCHVNCQRENGIVVVVVAVVQSNSISGTRKANTTEVR
jgi:hypothetical protein